MKHTNVLRSKFVRCLGITILFMIGFGGSPQAYESFTTIISCYQGVTLTTGMKEFDPTVITIIIGKSEEVEIVSAPKLDPLFEFSFPIDLYFGFSTDIAHPIKIVANNLTGMVVLEDTTVEMITEEMLGLLDCTERVVSIDSNDLVVLLTHDDTYMMLGDVRLQAGTNVRFTYWSTRTGKVPEPTTLLLIGGGILGIVGMTRWTSKNHNVKGGQ